MTSDGVSLQSYFLPSLQAGLLDANGEIAGFQTVQAGGKGKF